MTRKFLTILLLFSFLLPGLLLAQNAVLKANGTLEEVDAEALKISPKDLYFMQMNQKKGSNLDHITATADTLKYTNLGTWNTNFGQYGQDVMLQWFVAPADMDILAVRTEVTDDEWDQIEVKLVTTNWTEDQLMHIATEAIRLGHYEAEGNGFLDSNPFSEDETTTGDWVWTIDGASEEDSTAMVDEWGEPFGADLWSDFGAGAPVDLVADEWTDWVDLSLLFIPQVNQGEVFGVALKNTSTEVDDEVTPATRNGFLSSADRGIGAFKYYANGRNSYGPTGDWGWWHRNYTWNVEVAVSLTGDRAPVIHSFTQLFTTVSQDARTVEAEITDDNPSGGAAGVSEASINYSTDGGVNWTKVVMSGSEPNYTGEIPGFAPGTEILYYVEAVDVEGGSTRTGDVFYGIFLPVEQTLFVLDYSSFPAPGYEGYYYWITTGWSYDTWAAYQNGPVTTELLDNYQVVYHVMGDGPEASAANIGAAYKGWLDGATAEVPRRVFISGQDYGVISGFDDTTFVAGAFEYDYLGIETLGPQDINYDGSVASYQDAYGVTPIAESLTDTYAAFEGDSVKLYYWPYDELGWNNWIDNLTPRAEAIVDFTDPNQEDAVVGIHHSGDNWKTVFWPLDVVSLSFYSPEDTSSMYTWGLNVENLLAPVLEWFGEPLLSIESDLAITAGTYHLNQNYPNPFNPTTTIEYSIPNTAEVSLKVFDIQGREVATLLDKKNQKAGTHTVNFDASQYATGIYFYQLKTNDNAALVKKMMFIK
jgi:hypothetical protein